MSSPIAIMVERMIAAGVVPEMIALAVQTAELYAARPVESRVDIPVDTTAEKRRAWDRNRKKEKRSSGGNPVESGGIPPEMQKRHIEEESKKRTSSSRGTRIPPDWTLPENCRSWAVSAGLSQAEIDSEAQRFKDWWSARAGKDATKTDWAATWRNWCRNFLERVGRSATGPPTSEGQRNAERFAREAEEIRKSRERLNGKGHETGVDGSGTESTNHQGELLPPR